MDLRHIVSDLEAGNSQIDKTLMIQIITSLCPSSEFSPDEWLDLEMRCMSLIQSKWIDILFDLANDPPADLDFYGIDFSDVAGMFLQQATKKFPEDGWKQINLFYPGDSKWLRIALMYALIGIETHQAIQKLDGLASNMSLLSFEEKVVLISAYLSLEGDESTQRAILIRQSLDVSQISQFDLMDIDERIEERKLDS